MRVLSLTSGSPPGGGGPRVYGFESQQGLSAGAPQELRKQDSNLGGCTQVFTCTGTQGKAVTPEEPGPELPVSFGGSPDETGVNCGSLWGKDTHWWQKPQGIFKYMSSPGGNNFGIKTWPQQQPIGSSAGTSQAKQRTGWEHSPTHQHIGCLNSGAYSPPLNTLLDMALPTRGARPSSTHQWAGTGSSHQGADTRRKRKYNPAACRKETTDTKSKTK